MTALQLYAISETAPDHVPMGADGEELVQITESGLVAIVGRGGEPRSALEFARVVEMLADSGRTVLPARYGEDFADEPALRTAVAANATGLHRTLERVRGCVEVGIGAAFADPRTIDGTSGRDYLQARAANLHLIEELVAEVHEPLMRLARDSRLQQAHAPLRFAAAYLVPRGRLDAFRTVAERLTRTCSAATLVVTGPWPPYSFTAVEETR